MSPSPLTRVLSAPLVPRPAPAPRRRSGLDAPDALPLVPRSPAVAGQFPLRVPPGGERGGGGARLELRERTIEVAAPLIAASTPPPPVRSAAGAPPAGHAPEAAGARRPASTPVAPDAGSTGAAARPVAGAPPARVAPAPARPAAPAAGRTVARAGEPTPPARPVRGAGAGARRDEDADRARSDERGRGARPAQPALRAPLAPAAGRERAAGEPRPPAARGTALRAAADVAADGAAQAASAAELLRAAEARERRQSSAASRAPAQAQTMVREVLRPAATPPPLALTAPDDRRGRDGPARAPSRAPSPPSPLSSASARPAASAPPAPPGPRPVAAAAQAPAVQHRRPAAARASAEAPAAAAPISIEIGRIEIRTAPARAAAPPVRRATRPRAHVIDPGLRSGGRRR